MFSIMPISEADRSAVNNYIIENQSGPYVVTKGNILDTRTNPGFVALNDNMILGYELYNIANYECEITALESLLKVVITD